MRLKEYLISRTRNLAQRFGEVSERHGIQHGWRSYLLALTIAFVTLVQIGKFVFGFADSSFDRNNTMPFAATAVEVHSILAE